MENISLNRIELMLKFKDFDFGKLTPEEGYNLLNVNSADRDLIFSDTFTITSAYWHIFDLKIGYLAGENLNLMWALNIVSSNELLMPTWLAKELNSKISDVKNYEFKDWNAVFGNPVPKGKSIYTLKKDRELLFQIGSYVAKSCSTGRSVNNELFEEAAEKFNTNRDKVAKLYRAFCDLSSFNKNAARKRYKYNSEKN
ncbi:hypothetical protein [Acinetobacter sp. Marseille-Q1618]|uniref:hypothetical protein n=1 Tax=Acinetobacter sp. Marseille-Q1618 TaxID=2697502 RepID=UPI00156ECAF2|nr:hypothetical protein [Acinetobacter sp. Marseille-Q1618]